MYKTSTGFEFDVSADALDDWELLEELAELETDGSKIISVCRRLMGADGAQRLKEHCRGENGRVSITAMDNELSEIFAILREDKNLKN
jgi:hypothetical protein